MIDYTKLIETAYAAFNRRDIDTVLSLMHPEVKWPNGWEGGYVYGHEEVSAYWTRQWKELDPTVDPLSVTTRPDGGIEVDVHQVVKDINGQLLVDGKVKHVYYFEGDKIMRMEILE